MRVPIEFEMPRSRRAFVMDDFEGRDFIQTAVSQHGLLNYEPPLPLFMLAYLAQYGGPFLDVGANTGLYSLLAASVSPALEVIAFEPLDDIFKKLQHNIALNQLRTIKTVNLALSRTSGKTMFYETINDIGLLSTSSTLELSHAETIGAEFKSVEVTTVTLDEWAPRNQLHSASMIKIDAEGHESAVVEGGTAFLRKARPVMVVELLKNVNLAYFQRFVEESNYLNFVLAPGEIKQQQTIVFDSQSWNHILCPAERVYDVILAARAADLEPK